MFFATHFYFRHCCSKRKQAVFHFVYSVVILLYSTWSVQVQTNCHWPCKHPHRQPQQRNRTSERHDNYEKKVKVNENLLHTTKKGREVNNLVRFLFVFCVERTGTESPYFCVIHDAAWWRSTAQNCTPASLSIKAGERLRAGEEENVSTSKHFVFFNIQRSTNARLTGKEELVNEKKNSFNFELNKSLTNERMKSCYT